MRARLLVCVVLLAACATSAPTSSPDASHPDTTVVPDAMPCAGATNLGQSCSAGVGACMTSGKYICDATNTVVCDAVPNAETAELCNGIDDDCDGSIDEDFTTLGQSCSDGQGPCMVTGQIACDASGAATCNVTAGTGTTEQCNGIDDDCNGTIDDPWPIGQPCTAGTGACMGTGTYQCTSASSAACDAVAANPQPELCGDGIDQDCNGSDVACPTNDFPAGAIDISNGGTFSVDLSAAHDDNTGSCGQVGGRDVFYTFSLGAPEVVYLDSFGSNFDTVLRVYAGACTSLGTQQACLDDACGVRQTQGALALPAGQYCVVADQYYSTETLGAFVMRFVRGGRTGTAAAGGSGTHTITGDTTSGTSTYASHSCQANASGNDTTYFFTSCPGATTLTASTCTGTTWDTILDVYGGSSQLGCSDDNSGCTANTLSSSVSTSINGAGLYFVELDGYNGAKGAFTLTYSM